MKEIRKWVIAVTKGVLIMIAIVMSIALIYLSIWLTVAVAAIALFAFIVYSIHSYEPLNDFSFK